MIVTVQEISDSPNTFDSKLVRIYGKVINTSPFQNTITISPLSANLPHIIIDISLVQIIKSRNVQVIGTVTDGRLVARTLSDADTIDCKGFERALMLVRRLNF